MVSRAPPWSSPLLNDKAFRSKGSGSGRGRDPVRCMVKDRPRLRTLSLCWGRRAYALLQGHLAPT